MIGEVTHLGGLSGLSGRITLVAGEAIFQVNVSYYTCENATRGCKMYVNASYFSATARWATWPTWGPDPHISFFFLCRLSLSLVRENPALLLETFIMLLLRYFWSAEYFTFGSKAPLVGPPFKMGVHFQVCRVLYYHMRWHRISFLQVVLENKVTNR